jgi:Domain of unknown function (DUF1917)
VTTFIFFFTLHTMSDVSSESSFYGSPDRKENLDSFLDDFDPVEALKRPSTFIETALRDAEAAALKTNEHPGFNPYADDPASWQIGESVDHFLKRLPPSTTQAADVGAWIWVADPYAKRIGLGGDQAGLMNVGMKILEKLKEEKKHCEKQYRHEGSFAPANAFNPIRKQYTDQLLDTAKQHNVTSGKWLLFTPVHDVDRVWSIVADGTVRGSLGVGAKVATASGESGQRDRIICVYTKDFGDITDVTRVLHQMQKLRLVENAPYRGIYYKPDVFTHLGINSGNEWEIKPGLYASKDIFGGKKRKPVPSAAEVDTW